MLHSAADVVARRRPARRRTRQRARQRARRRHQQDCQRSVMCMCSKQRLYSRRFCFSTNTALSTECDLVQLSVFAHRFMSIAEQMGFTLRRTAISVNIKERLDFSCALFGADGRYVSFRLPIVDRRSSSLNVVVSLVANAPHLPVHLGAMQVPISSSSSSSSFRSTSSPLLLIIIISIQLFCFCSVRRKLCAGRFRISASVGATATC